jgi:fermentation-respiration switch protein FrsA (DUF1100 family)
MVGTTLFAPFAPLVRSRMNNLRKVAEARPPKLLLHGTEDPLVPFEMAERLSQAARAPAELVPLPGARHNDTFSYDPDLYYGAIDDFLEMYVRGSRDGDEG